MLMRLFGVFSVVFATIVMMFSAHAQFEGICEIPKIMEGQTERAFEVRRAELLSAQIGLIARGEQFNGRCKSVGQGTPAFENCAVEYGQLLDQRENLNVSVAAFCTEMESARLRVLFDRIAVDIDVRSDRRTDEKLEALFDEALQADWSSSARMSSLLSLLKVGRGAYERAREFLKLGRHETDHDAFVERLDVLVTQRLIDDITTSGGPLVDPFVAEQQAERVDIVSHGMIVRGAYHLGHGDYEVAVQLFTDARSRAGTSPSTQRALDDAIVWARELRAAMDERLQPGARRASYERMRDQAEAEQAWRLGWATAVSGKQPDRSQALMKQAAAFFDRNDPAGLGEVVSSQLEQVRQGRVVHNPATAADLARAPSRTHAVLDALEFGKGDWDRSLEYIRDRRRLLPGDQHLRDAEIYLEGLSAGR